MLYEANRMATLKVFLSKLLKLWNYEIFQVISLTESVRKKFKFKLFYKPNQFAKSLKISKQAIQAMKFWIFLSCFVEKISSRKNSVYLMEAIRAMHIWNISSYFVHQIGSRKV